MERGPIWQESMLSSAPSPEDQLPFLRAALEAIPDAVNIYDAEGRLIWMNQTASRLFGYTPRERTLELVERHRLDRVHGEDKEPLPLEKLPAWRALKGQTVQSELLQFHVNDASPAWVFASAAPVLGRDGDIVGAISVFTDVSALHRKQEQIRHVLRAVTHDLRTPLSVIQGRAHQMMRMMEKGAMDARHRGIAEAILTACRRIGVMLGELVDSIRVETGRVELAREPTDLAEFLRALLERVSASLEVRRIRLQVESDVPRVHADPDRLERIVLNLVTNALKYSPPESEVEIAVRAGEGEAVLSVADRGIGIAAEDLPNIFDAFFRAPGTEGAKGIGLGLAITRALVEAHGGRISATSTPGKGSVFEVRLPVEQVPSPREPLH